MADMGKAHAHLFISKESHDGKNDVQVQVIRMADDDLPQIYINREDADGKVQLRIGAPSVPEPPAPPSPPRGTALPTPPIPPVMAFAMPHGEHNLVKKGTTTALGTREFDGVKAEGTRISYTIAAGEIGNEKPITVTSETWYSPELQVVVYTRHSDPRAGETSYRLAGIKRGEPPAELFKVPADYRSPKGAREKPRKE